MKYLKIFEEFAEPSLRDKLESIVSMYEYIWNIGCADSLQNFSGDASELFSYHAKIRKGWRGCR